MPLSRSFARTFLNYQLFTAAASQTVFTLTDFTNAVGTNRLMVLINGLPQIRTDFTETNTTTVTLSEGATVGDIVEMYLL